MKLLHNFAFFQIIVVSLPLYSFTSLNFSPLFWDQLVFLSLAFLLNFFNCLYIFVLQTDPHSFSLNKQMLQCTSLILVTYFCTQSIFSTYIFFLLTDHKDILNIEFMSNDKCMTITCQMPWSTYFYQSSRVQMDLK